MTHWQTYQAHKEECASVLRPIHTKNDNCKDNYNDNYISVYVNENNMLELFNAG